MRRVEALLLLSLSPACAHAAELSRVEAGVAVEDYSFTESGLSQWSAARVKLSPRWGLTAGQALVRRFHLNDPEGRLGVDARLGRATGAEAAVTVSPDALVLPRVSVSGLLYQGLGPLSLTPGYKHARYEVGDVNTYSFGLSAARGRLEATARGYASQSLFRGVGGDKWTPGLLALLTWRERRWFLSPSYAFREEAFQAGAPGAFRSQTFKAHTGRLELGARIREPLEARLAYQYEGRIPSNYVRQYELAVAALF